MNNLVKLLNMVAVGAMALIMLDISKNAHDSTWVSFVAGSFSVLMLILFGMLALQLSNTTIPANVTKTPMEEIRELRKAIQDDASAREMWRIRVEDTLGRMER